MNTNLAVVITTVLLAIAGKWNFVSASHAPLQFKLQAELPQFWNRVERNAKLSVVATGFGFTERPVWNEAGFLYVSDETIKMRP